MAGGRYKDDINSGLYPTYVEPETANYQQYRALKSNVGDIRSKGIQQAQALTPGDDMGVTPQAAREGEDYRVEQQKANEAWNIARLNKAREQGTMNDFVPTTYGFGIPRTAIPTVQREQTQPPAAPAQRATGGGQAIAAENPDRQQRPATNPQPAVAGTDFAAEDWGGGFNVQAKRDQNTGRLTEFRTEAPVGSAAGSGWGKVVSPATGNQARGLPTAEQLAEYQNQQAAMRRYGNIMRPNGESDRDFNANSQVVITPGRGRATNNPGYTFVGGAGDAARFFQPVPHGGGYNPYKQRFRTLFDEQMDARRVARAQPEKPQMDMTLPGNSRRAKYHEQMQAYNNELNQGFGLDAKQMENALQRQRLAQEYGVNMAQLGNDTLRTQAALGLNGLQQMQTMQQMRQQQMLDNARYTLATADPNSDAYKRAERVAKAYEDGKERNFGFQTVDVDNGDGTTSKRIYVTDPSTGTVAPAQMAGGQGGEPYALDERQIAQAFSSPAGIKALQDGTWEKYLQDIREKAKKLKS